MILVDTSIWVDHLRRPDPTLQSLLENGEVLTHPHVVGEVLLGNLTRRGEIMLFLYSLPWLHPVPDALALEFIESASLAGTGLGLVDVHLLAAAVAGGNVMLWTRDRRLGSLARRFGLTRAAWDAQSGL